MNFAESLLIEKERFPLFVPVILGVGIICGVFFPFLDWYPLLIFSSISLLLSVFLIKKHKILSACIFIFSLGIYISQTGGILRTDLLSQKKFIEKEYDPINFTADVKFIDETHPTMKNMRRITFININFPENPDLAFVKSAKMTCSAAATDNVLPNDMLQIKGKITPYRPADIPGTFDQIQYNSLVGLDTTGIVYKIEKIGKKKNLLEFFSYIRCFLTKKITSAMKNPAGGIASALLTGDKSPISPEIRDKFINSGTAHILAISGLHMSIVASMLFLIFSKSFRYVENLFYRLNSKTLSAILTILFTFLYLGLSGFSPSAVRAFIMTTIFLISIILGRKALSLRSVSVAAFLILLIDSGSVFLVSFQLSFCAVVALISFYETFQKKLNRLLIKYTKWYKKIFFYVTTSFITTIIASLATSPVSIETFNRLSLSGVLGNLVAIPAISFIIMPLGGISLIASWSSEVFVALLEYTLNQLTFLLGLISEIPGSNLTVKSPDILTLYMIVFGGIILCILKTSLRHVGSALMLIGTLIWIFEKKPDIIIPPESDIICFVKDGNFYTTSVRKGRKKALSIQRNLGFSGKLEKKEAHFLEKKECPKGLFIWSKQNKVKQIAEKIHPYCPTHFENANISAQDLLNTADF
ncbi:MAG: ComEC/Rec2 family competence protein [Holosporales bacterium]|jgi:competence protein ComEC|nr:ComEC/Rec2 family competence protein [Holosporales bacterium]